MGLYVGNDAHVAAGQSGAVPLFAMSLLSTKFSRPTPEARILTCWRLLNHYGQNGCKNTCLAKKYTGQVLDFDRISFAYENSVDDVLRDISFCFHAGRNRLGR